MIQSRISRIKNWSTVLRLRPFKGNHPLSLPIQRRHPTQHCRDVPTRASQQTPELFRIQGEPHPPLGLYHQRTVWLCQSSPLSPHTAFIIESVSVGLRRVTSTTWLYPQLSQQNFFPILSHLMLCQNYFEGDWKSCSIVSLNTIKLSTLHHCQFGL